MSEHPGTSQGVTVAEAAAILGVSTTTIRRMIRRGQLEAQTVLRPQGRAFLVTLPVDAGDAAGGDHDTRQDAHDMSRTQAAPTGQMTAWSETFLLPLVAALERQAERIGELERENGRLTERLALMAPESVPAANLTRQSSETTPTPLDRLRALPHVGAVTVLAALTIVAVLVLMLR